MLLLLGLCQPPLPAVSLFSPTAGLPPPRRGLCLYLLTHCRAAPPLQVSFRYHCQLYSEWRKTHQKVRLKIREADGSEDPHHSLLATGLFKKVAEETPV